MIDLDDRSTWASPAVVGERIHRVRLHERLTREDFCERIYTNVNSYQMWRSGRKYPKVGDILEMMGAFNLTAQDLLDVHSRIDDDGYEASHMFNFTYWCDIDAPKRIRDLMREKGITRQQLTKAIGVSPQTVRNWLKGNNCPNKNATERLARYFGVSIADLLESESKRKE